MTHRRAKLTSFALPSDALAIPMALTPISDPDKLVSRRSQHIFRCTGHADYLLQVRNGLS